MREASPNRAWQAATVVAGLALLEDAWRVEGRCPVVAGFWRRIRYAVRAGLQQITEGDERDLGKMRGAQSDSWNMRSSVASRTLAPIANDFSSTVKRG